MQWLNEHTYKQIHAHTFIHTFCIIPNCRGNICNGIREQNNNRTEEDTKHPKLNLFPPLNFATQNTNLKFNFALTK